MYSTPQSIAEKTVMELPRLCLVVLSLCLCVLASPPPQHKGAVTPTRKTMPVLKNATVLPTPAIVGGNEASRGLFKYQAAIFIDGKFFCGGSLISDSYILTAGHCVEGSSHWIIYLGTLHLTASEFTRQIAQTIDATLHQDYDSSRLTNDVALLNLRTPVQLTGYVQPVELPTANDGSFLSMSVRVSGWGKTSDYTDTISEVLYYTDLTVISNAECSGIYGNIVTSGTICAKGSGGTNPCNGDSGGPLVARFNDKVLLAGVTSFVASVSCTSYPSGYARVTYYRDWIKTYSGV